MKTDVMVLVGSRKGVFIMESSASRRRWKTRGPYLAGQSVMHMAFDPRSGILFAATGDPWFGSRIYRSTDMGTTWDEPASGPTFPADSGYKLERVWHVAPGRADEPGVVYAGVEPAALFKSTDDGATWSWIEALSNHPTRDKWQPGAGGLCLHTIVLHPTDVQRVMVGISAVGVFQTTDAGASWNPTNTGIRTNFMPDQPPEYPEWGQCIHKIVSSGDGWLYQQNHCGVYRSNDFGQKWEEVTGDLPSDWGFVAAAHPHDTKTFYVCPGTSGYHHWVPEGKPAVYRTTNRGDSWERMDKGFPKENAYINFLRDAMAVDRLDDAGIYLGSNTGQLYFSRNNGDSWHLAEPVFPPINSVGTITL